MNYQVKTLFDGGSARWPEDAFVDSLPFFGVLDGVSGLYEEADGPRMFDEVSGGKRVTEIIANTVSGADAGEPLFSIMQRANTAVSDFAKINHLDTARADLLPGAVFAFAKIGEESIEIVQGGDCFAVWQKTSGETGATPNQNYLHDKQQLETLHNLLLKHDGDRAQAWKEYLPLSSQMRREHANAEIDARYIILNGQTGSPKLWNVFSLPRKNVKLLLLFTDGLVNFEQTEDENSMARKMIQLYEQGGLQSMLENIRSIEAGEDKKLRHTDHAEIAAVAIDFK